MATAQAQKMKLLYLMRILMERTDENHMLTANELCDILQMEYDVPAERKSIYNDIAALQEFGLDVMQQKGSAPGYYIGSRAFELAELKLLVDAVQASKSITEKKTDELIRKLESLASHEEARQLQQQVFLYKRAKTENETVYYNVDYIHTAIYTNVQIRFRYTAWTKEKEVCLKRDGTFYVVSPWALTWNDENYYMIAYDAQADQLRHYRVDKMQQMELLSESRRGKEQFDHFDIVAFEKRTFGMFGGRQEKVTLLCEDSLAGVILDRFGKDVMMVPQGEHAFRVSVDIAVSPQFFGWAAGLGIGVQILRPESVREEFLAYLQNICGNYQ
ncbi:MAG: WYL domain-containing protein [Clostridiales bacterium]|nr:WYL domain-containing protein [Clostridiales bacterium]